MIYRGMSIKYLHEVTHDIFGIKTQIQKALICNCFGDKTEAPLMKARSLNVLNPVTSL